MRAISAEDIKLRIERDNPWWRDTQSIIPESRSPKRVYFSRFHDLAANFNVRRATVLFGPRRVGKTFMLKQFIHEIMREGIHPENILYVSIDTPIYSGISLEKFLHFMPARPAQERKLVIFDEIQYLKDWEVHLKDLVDLNPHIKFIASGSAAAALRLKSRESGAGRFSDFMLPPLTFYEFLDFIGEGESFIKRIDASPAETKNYQIKDIQGLNSRFIDYLNYGGYPEAVMNNAIRSNPEQFIKNDIIDKVLLKDLPSLYGITGIQELNRLFSFLAYNTGNEASFENIAKESGIIKPTIKNYIEYLESAFLVIKVLTVTDNCKSLKRERNFKIYLNNPSMRAALFAPVRAEDSQSVGRLTESAIFSQWQHASGFKRLKYARWRNEGEVDIVYLGQDQRPAWIGEIKWSDKVETHFREELRSLAALLRRHSSIEDAVFTTRTVHKDIVVEGRPVQLMPSAAYCYIVGRNITSRLAHPVADSPGVKDGTEY